MVFSAGYMNFKKIAPLADLNGKEIGLLQETG